MKVFFAMPYTQLCDSHNLLKKQYKLFFKKLLKEMDNINCEYFLAHKRENWGKEYTSDVESTLIDYNTIKEVDFVCVLPGIPNSGGVHVEVGWASAHNKRMKIFLKKNCNYSPMITGIKCLTDVEYIYYDEEFNDNFLSLIVDCVKKEMRKEK